MTTVFQCVRDGMRPHNRGNGNGIDLRKHPVCYLFGRHWQLLEKSGKAHRKAGDNIRYYRLVVQCEWCKLLTYAEADRSVMHAWEWVKHK